jgi:hypothetical protein
VRGEMKETFVKDKIESLEKKLEDMERRYYTTRHHSILNDLNGIQKSVQCREEEITDKLLKMIDSDEEIDINIVTSKLGISIAELHYLVGELVDHNLLEYTKEGDADITQQGKNYIKFRDSIRSMGFID